MVYNYLELILYHIQLISHWNFVELIQMQMGRASAYTMVQVVNMQVVRALYKYILYNILLLTNF